MNLTNPSLNFDQHFKKMQAIQSSEERKIKAIEELYRGFMQKGFSEYMSRNLAQEQYNAIHKNKLK